MPNPTKLFKVSLSVFNTTKTSSPRINTDVREYDVVNITEKSYVMKDVKAMEAGVKIRPRSLAKEEVDQYKVSGAPEVGRGEVWVFGNTGLALDILKAKLVEMYTAQQASISTIIKAVEEES